MTSGKVYTIGMEVKVSGDREAEKKITKVGESAEKVKKKVKDASKLTMSATAKLEDKATSKLEKIEKKRKEMEKKVTKTTVDATDNATDKLKKTKTAIKEIEEKKLIEIEAKEKVSSAIEKVDGKLKSWFKAGAKKVISIGLAGSVALGGLGLGASLNTYMDFEKGLSNVKAVTGATAAEMQVLKDTAKDLGASTAWSAVQVTQAEELLGQAGFSVKETTSALPGLLSLASAGDLELAEATDIASGTLRAFSMEASNTGHVADVLALSASATNSDVTDLGETMKYAAPVAQALGISFEDTAAAAGLLSNANIKGSQAGTILRQTLARLASPTDQAAKMMKKYGINAFDSKGNMKSLSDVVDNLNSSLGKLTSQQRADVISTVFGTESMSGVMALMNQGGESLSSLSERLIQTKGAADDMASTKLDNLAGQWTILKSAVEGMNISLGEKLAPYAKQFVTWLTDKIPVIENKIVSIVDYISKHTDDIKSMAIAITGVVGSIAGLSVAGSIGNSISGISKFVSIIKGAGVAKETAAIAGGFDLIGVAAKALPALISPTGIAITAAVATTAYAVHSYNKLMKESVDTATEDLSIGEKIMNKLTGSVLKSKKELQEAGVIYDDFGQGISDDFKKAAQDASKSLLEIEMNINRLNVDGVMDESDKHYFRQYVNEFAYEGINAMKEQKSKIESEFKKTFMLDGVVSETEQNVMDTLEKYFGTGMNKQKELREKVYEIFDEAFVDHSKSVDQAMSEIKSKLEEMKSLELEYTKANNAYEQAYAQNQFKKDASKVTSLNGASELMQKRAEEHNKQLDEIDNNYAGTLAYYDSLLSNSNLSNEERENFEKGKVEAETARNEAYAKAQEAWQSDLETLYQTFPGAKDKDGRSLLNEYTGEKLSTGDIKAQNRMDSMLNEYSGLNNVTESGVYSFTNSNGNLESFYVQVDETTKKITRLYETATQRAGGYTEEISNNIQDIMSEQETAVSQIMNNLANSQPHLDLATNTIKDYSGFTISELENVTVAADKSRTGIATINDIPLEIKTNADGVIESITLVNRTLDEINGKTVSATVNITQSSSIKQLNQEKLEMRKQQRGYASGTDYATSGIHEVAEHGVELVVGRQYRNFDGGEKVLNNSETKSFFKGLGKSQVYQPQQQVQVVGGGGNTFGDINLNVNNGQNPEQIIQQACQEFARQLREALFNTK